MLGAQHKDIGEHKAVSDNERQRQSYFALTSILYAPTQAAATAQIENMFAILREANFQLDECSI